MFYKCLYREHIKSSLSVDVWYVTLPSGPLPSVFKLSPGAKISRAPGSHVSQIKKEGKKQESIQPSTTPDPGYQWESDNVTIRYHKREPRGQPFPSK